MRPAVRCLGFLLSATVGGCATLPAPAPVESLSRCDISGPPASWYEFADEDVRLCLPSGWLVRPGEASNEDGSMLRWGPAPMDTAIPDESEFERVFRSVQTIGGWNVELEALEDGRGFRTSARWTDGPNLAVRGWAPSPAAARQHLAIVRSVRPAMR